MKAIKLYPEYYKKQQEYGSFYGPSDYQPIISSLGRILIQVDDDDYQGDSRVLLEKDGKYGLLIFGWGSCSGCDALQACENMHDIQILIDNLSDSVKWFDSLLSLKRYINEKDWELEYSWHARETREFIESALNYHP